MENCFTFSLLLTIFPPAIISSSSLIIPFLTLQDLSQQKTTSELRHQRRHLLSDVNSNTKLNQMGPKRNLDVSPLPILLYFCAKTIIFSK